MKEMFKGKRKVIPREIRCGPGDGSPRVYSTVLGGRTFFISLKKVRI